MQYTTATNVDEYIACFPADVAEMLTQIRETIVDTAPEAVESISYQMPGYKLSGMLVYFAGYKKHIGFYPGAGAIEKFRDELKDYKTSKGTIQFPLDAPLPLDLIKRIVDFRVKENVFRAAAKKR